MSTGSSPVIHVSAVVLRDQGGRVLTVRKRGTERFMFPGGKPEGTETADEAALREVSEEVGVDLDPTQLRPIGDFTTAAANEEGFSVAASVFSYGPTATDARVLELAPAAEIAEVRWVELDADWPGNLAPLLSEAVFPHLLEGPEEVRALLTGPRADGADAATGPGIVGDVPAAHARAFESRHVGQVIARDPADVYAFAADPANLPRWAAGVAVGEVTLEGRDVHVDSPMGPVTLRFVDPNDLGVLDHDVTLPDGTVVSNPMRVLGHPAGSEVVFTVRRGGMSDQEFEADVAAVRVDLENLRGLLEA